MNNAQNMKYILCIILFFVKMMYNKGSTHFMGVGYNGENQNNICVSAMWI